MLKGCEKLRGNYLRSFFLFVIQTIEEVKVSKVRSALCRYNLFGIVKTAFEVHNLLMQSSFTQNLDFIEIQVKVEKTNKIIRLKV